jgi:hypothetical protein
MANVVVSAIATFNGKALTKGKKQLTDFEKTTQKLGKTFTKVFAGVAFLAFGKNAVNAFIESEKAAAKLRTTVKNLGLEFEQPGIDKYLQGLSLQFGIIDENLIPGFQRLLIATKDVSKAQSLFETALNVSAGTGKDLNAVTTSLSKAYMGDSVSLGSLGVGLSKAQLKSASFLDIQRTLNVNFAGQAAAAVEGYAGDMAKLTVAVDESKEAIGKGLLDALKALSGDTSIDTFTSKMVKSAETIGNAFGSVIDFLQLLNPNATFEMGGARLRKKDFSKGNFQYGAGNPRADLLVTKNISKARKDELAIITASNKAKTEIDKLRDKFDLERIGLTAALNAATDEETKLRIRAQLAILDNNEALAKKYNAELEAATAANRLATSANTAATFLDLLASRPNPLFTSTGEMTARGRNQIAPFEGSTTYTVPQGVTNQGQQAAAGAAASTPTQATLEIAPNASADRLVQAIAETVRVNLKYGNKLVPAGGLD